MNQRKYITYNEELTSRLESMGFKRKGKYVFVKERGNVICELAFSHSTHNKHYIKYYTILVTIVFKKVQEIVNAIDVVVGGMGTNIGYLSPECSFKEWEIEESSSDWYISLVISDIYNHIINYAIPYYERYLDIRNVISDIEQGKLANQIDGSHFLPILYFLNGEKGFAVSFMRRELLRKKNLSEKKYKDYPFILKNCEEKSSSPEYREYKEYKVFVERFKKYINVKHSD